MSLVQNLAPPSVAFVTLLSDPPTLNLAEVRNRGDALPTDHRAPVGRDVPMIDRGALLRKHPNHMRLQRLLPGLIALALGVLAPRSARAQPEVSSTAVLGLEGIDVPLALTDELSEQLRQRVSASRDLHLVPGKDLVEVKLVFGCADEAASCMAQAGKSLEAQRLIYGSVKKAGDDYAVWIKMFDVRRARVEFWLTETLPRRNADAAGIKVASARWLAKLTGRPVDAGTIQVTSNVYGALVALDGVQVGATGEQPLTIADVAPGKHELSLAKPGYAPGKQQFLVAPGQTVPINLSLASVAEAVVVSPPPLSPVTPPPPPLAQTLSPDGYPLGGAPTKGSRSSDGLGAYRTGFWVTLAAAVAGAGAAVKFGLDVTDINKKLDPYRRFPCKGDQLCDGKGVVQPALTAGEKNQVSSLNDEGNRDQTLQWICVGVGSALGVASGYLFYKGYLDSDEEHSTRESQRGLRIFPTASANGSGIVAEFEF